jgi:hypothetical protein
MTRRAILSTLVMLAFLLVPVPAYAAPNATPTLVTVRALGGTSISVSGRVTASGVGIQGANVSLTLGAAAMGKVNTTSDGAFSATLQPPAGVTGTVPLVATYAGSPHYAASSATVVVAVGVAATPTSAAPTSTTPTSAAPTQAPGAQIQNNPTQPRPGSFTGLSVPTSADAGSLATVSGTLLDESGTPLGAGDVEAIVDGTSVGGATTDGAGAWQLYVPIPATVSSGSLTVTLTYPGDAAHPAVRTTASITVTTAPAVNTAAPTPQPVPSVTSAPSSKVASATPSNAGVLSSARWNEGGTMILIVGGVVVVLLAVVSLMVIGGRLRGRRARRLF